MNTFVRHTRQLISIAALLVLAANEAVAGGPNYICGSTALKYPGTVTLNYDQGNLGGRTKAQADAIVTGALSIWTNVTTSSLVFARGADMPVDVTAANFMTYFNGYSDGFYPIVYDTDGSIIDSLYGVGAKNFVLGFSAAAVTASPPCQLFEGIMVLNGNYVAPDTDIAILVAHEAGHLIGLDHTQLDSAQGIAASDQPFMYPTNGRISVTLHEDDQAAVSALYPDATLNSVYGQISGTFVLADGVTAVRGANLWATEITSNKHYSIVSDYLIQNTGYFKLLLPAGTYNLRAEAIRSNFTGGSGVGPYSTDSAGLSFQPPLYVAGVPMATVTLGNATPTSFSINSGCAATLTFRIDGTGVVGGNCLNVPGAPSIGIATAGNAQASVSFTAPASNGGSTIISYTAI